MSGLFAGNGALIGFDLPSAEAASRFVDALWLFRVSKAYGDVRSTVVAPLTRNRVLLSIGLEHEDDILAELQQTLAKTGPN
jgi:O-acetylhomoserine (thiol)-lyase